MIILTAGLYPGAKGNNEAGVKSKFVGQDSANRAYLEDPRQGQKGSSRALGWTSNTGNYFGADGVRGQVRHKGFGPLQFELKMITLPRQARDKHRENSERPVF